MYCPLLTISHAVALNSSESAVTFRGLLVQARLEADDSPIGQFSNFSPDTRQSSCIPPEVYTDTCMYIHGCKIPYSPAVTPPPPFLQPTSRKKRGGGVTTMTYSFDRHAVAVLKDGRVVGHVHVAIFCKT